MIDLGDGYSQGCPFLLRVCSFDYNYLTNRIKNTPANYCIYDYI
nr:MAG TPA: Sin3 associated polypeptide p18 (SAP18) [Caudoviricetes sp.]